MTEGMDVRTSVAALLLSNLIPSLQDHAARNGVPINEPVLAEGAADVAVTLTDALLERLKR